MIKKTLLFCSLLTTHAWGVVELVHKPKADDAFAPFLALKGAYEHVNGDTKQAAITYAQLSTLAPESEHLKQARINLAFDRAEYATVVQQAHQIDITNPAHKKNAQRLAQAYLFSNRLCAARDTFAALRAQYPHDDSFDYYAAVTAIKMEDFVGAHRIINHVLAQSGRESKHFLFHFLNAKIAFLSGKYDAAMTHVTTSLAFNSRFAKGMMLKAAIAEKQNRLDLALATYEKYLTMMNDPTVINRIVSLCFSTKNYPKAYKLLLAQPRTTIDHFHDLAVLAMKMGKNPASHAHIDKVLAKDSTFAKGQKLKLHLLCEEQRFDDIAEVLKQWLHAQPRNQTLISRAYSLKNKGMTLRALIHIFKHVANRKSTMQLCFALGDLLHEEGGYEAARSWYEIALRDRTVAPRGLQASKLYTQMARTLYMQKLFSKARGVLIQAQTCTPVYPSAYNLSALVLLKTNGDPQQAKAFIELALQAAPDHAPYLETLSQLLQ